MNSFRSLCALGLGLTLLSGCSNNPYPQASTKNDGTASTVWYQSLQEDPRTLDPQVQYNTVSNEILANITEGLYQYQYLKRINGFDVEPALADGMPVRTPNPGGGETWTLKIKPGMRFQDDPCFADGKGREVTSDDFIYAIKRIADPHIKNPTASPVYPTFSTLIVGMQAFYEKAEKAGKTDYNQPIKGIQKVDRYTFKIVLTEPYPQLKYWLTMTFFAPVPLEAVAYYDGQDHDGERRPPFMFKPVGTGAYKLDQWDRNQKIILTRNENFRQELYPKDADPNYIKAGFTAQAGKAMPFADVGYYSIIREAIPNWTLFRQGYIDSLGDNARGLSSSTMQQVVGGDKELTPEFKRMGLKKEFVPELSLFFLAFNMTDAVVGNNKKLRQAIATAYPAARYIDTFHGGSYIKPESPLPPGVFGNDLNYRSPSHAFNLERAKQLLKEAGYPNGIDPKTGKPLSIDIVFQNNGPGTARQSQFFIQEYAKAGIKINMRLVTFAELQSIQQQGRYQMVQSGWLADYPDPENFFFLLYSKSDPFINASRYNNPEFDRLFLKMKTMENTPERRAIVNKMIDMVNEDCVWLYLYNEAYYTTTHAWANNVLKHPVAFNTLKFRNIDPELRAEKQKEWNQPNYIYVLALAGALTALVLPVTLMRKD